MLSTGQPFPSITPQRTINKSKVRYLRRLTRPQRHQRASRLIQQPRSSRPLALTLAPLGRRVAIAKPLGSAQSILAGSASSPTLLFPVPWPGFHGCTGRHGRTSPTHSKSISRWYRGSTHLLCNCVPNGFDQQSRHRQNGIHETGRTLRRTAPQRL